MTFRELAHYLDALEKTSSRIEITKILAELFKKVEVGEIDKTTYLLLGRLAPSYEDVVFNIAEKMILKVLTDAYGVDTDIVSQLYKQKGDLGEAAFSMAQDLGKGKVSKKGKELNIGDVYKKLYEIAVDEGEGSQDRKVEDLAQLLRNMDPLSARFLVRIPLGKLRLGFSDKTVLDALSWMVKGDKSEKGKLETAYNAHPDVGALAMSVKKKGIDKTADEIEAQLGVPLLPMLAQRLKSPKEMIKKMHEVAVESKFDGLRIQIHYKKSGFGKGKRKSGTVRAFTRNLNETSWMFPELEGVAKEINADSVILDSEAVGVDEERKSLANFQTTMTRRRKHDIGKTASKVGIRFFVFDVMYKNGTSLIKQTYEERRKVLEKTIKSGNVLQLVDYDKTNDPEEIAKLMNEKLAEGLEGIIVKRFDSRYVAGRTGWRWVKMKEEETSVAKLSDTIDCVVMGYYAGRGKRVGFGIGGFLVGVYDKDKIKSITKIGTGLTDEQFKEMKKELSKSEVKEKPKMYDNVEKILIPDNWVEPSLVVEIAADEITKSPIHTSGFALRFPRLVKFRYDKGPSEATTLSEIKKLFKLQ